MLYVQYRYKKWLVEPDKIKVKLLGGDTFLVELMGDASNTETYMKWYFNYLRVIVERKSDVKLLACAESLKRAIKRSEEALQGSQEGIQGPESRA
jgi:hypothetical protein